MARYGPVLYRDDAEKALQFEIFKENIKHIEDDNSVGGHKLYVHLLISMAVRSVVNSGDAPTT